MRQRKPAGPELSSVLPEDRCAGATEPNRKGSDGVLDLQRSAGNRTTVAALGRHAQAKLTVGPVDDPYEREADAVASAVLAHLAAASASPPTPGHPSVDPVIGRRPAPGGISRRAVGAEGGEVDTGTEAAIDGARRGGHALGAELRRSMEGAFGADFSTVKLHSGPQSAALNDAVGAEAFTIGSDIFLGASAPDLSTRAGQGLLAHELAHTVQQGGSGPAAGAASVQRFPASALADPPVPRVDWKADTESVAKSGEGKSGGVFFLKTKGKTDPVQTIVIKPNYGVNANNADEHASQLIFGDRVVSSLFGLGAPASRIVPKGSPEFAAIVDLIKPKDSAPTDPQDLKFWHPVTEAGAMIVMGAVPNAASLSSLAESAMDDPKAEQRLHSTVFDPAFLFDLGKLMVADLLMGNDDRMVAGAMNVGNIMVSSSKDGNKLYAIDSRAVLPDFDPKTVIENGSASLTGFSSTVDHLKQDPPYYLDGFFETLKQWYHGGVEKIKAGQEKKAPENTIDPADLLWLTYQAQRGRLLVPFTAGFQDGMSTVMALSDTKGGQDKMKGLTDEFAGQEGSSQVQSLALKTNAQYLSNRAKGRTHEEAAKDPAGAAALVQLASLFNQADYRLPENDEFFWTRGRPPSGDALGAALEDFKTPKPEDMAIGAGKLSSNTGNFNPKNLSKLAASIDDVKSELDSLGKKSRGAFSKKEQLRNRAVAGRFIADTYLLGAGGVRAAAYAKKLFELGKFIEMATTTKIDPAVAPSAIPAVQFLIAYRKQLQRHLDEYTDALAAASKGVARVKRFEQRAEVARMLQDIAEYTTRCSERYLGAKQVLNANVFLNLLKSAG